MADEKPEETPPESASMPDPEPADAPPSSNDPTPGERAEDAMASVEAAAEAVDEAVSLPDFDGSHGPRSDASGISLLDDVDLDVKIELGRTMMYVEDVLRLNTDSVIELDKAAGDPVDIYVNNRHVARGEVLVLSENFAVRVSEIIDPARAEE